jgi:hypothetical protein
VDRRILLAAGAVALAIVLFFVLRPDDDEDATPSANTTTEEETTAPGTTTTATQTTETSPTTAEGPPPPTELRITYANGRIRGGVQRFTVNKGERVVIVVRSDVEDEVHLHGYDLLVGVEPGKRARISFRATDVGSFEIEFESRHLPLAELEVVP